MTRSKCEPGRLGLVGAAMASCLTVAFAAFAASPAAGQDTRPNAPADLSIFDSAEPDALGAKPSDALQALMAQAADGAGDPHLPFILARLKKALADQDLIGFLDLVDPAHYQEQMDLLSQPGRSPGVVLGQFACEFFAICDISKDYGFNDIVSMDVLGASSGFAGGGLVTVRIELRMWDGLSLATEIFYDPNSARLSSGVG